MRQSERRNADANFRNRCIRAVFPLSSVMPRSFVAGKRRKALPRERESLSSRPAPLTLSRYAFHMAIELISASFPMHFAGRSHSVAERAALIRFDEAGHFYRRETCSSQLRGRFCAELRARREVASPARSCFTVFPLVFLRRGRTRPSASRTLVHGASILTGDPAVHFCEAEP